MILISGLIIVIGIAGCFKEIVETREPLPELVWPDPPETARIHFVNSISTPEHLNIRASLSERMFKFIKGEIRTPMNNPYGLFVDAENRLFVVDNFSNCVHVYDKQNHNYYKFPQDEKLFLSPIDITIDKKGNVYVTDSKNGVVKVFTNRGKKYIKDIGKGFLERPTGIAINEKTEELLVVDTVNSQIIRYNLNDHKLIGTIGRAGTEAGMFNYPTNIFVSRSGDIFVSDSLNFRIQIFTPNGIFINAFGAAGDSPGYFSRPRGVAVDSDENIYIVDALFDNIQVFDKTGKLLMAFGEPGNTYGKFWLPSGIFIDSNDKIYVSDSYNNRVQVFQYLKTDIFSEP
jgi:DNA-binding beta-propeller fold protein YncE